MPASAPETLNTSPSRRARPIGFRRMVTPNYSPLEERRTGTDGSCFWLDWRPHALSDIPSIQIDWSDPLAWRWLRFWPWPFGEQKRDVYSDEIAANSPACRADIDAFRPGGEGAAAPRRLWVAQIRSEWIEGANRAMLLPMVELLKLLCWAVIGLFRSQASLKAKNLALRHQLATSTRMGSTPRSTRSPPATFKGFPAQAASPKSVAGRC